MYHAYINTRMGIEEKIVKEISVYVISCFGSNEIWQINKANLVSFVSGHFSFFFG